MPLLSAAALYLGDRPVDKVYLGDRLVWPLATAGDWLRASLEIVHDMPRVLCSLTWGGTAPTRYRYFLSVDGGPWTLHRESGLDAVELGTQHSASVRARAQSFDDTGLLAEALSGTVLTDGAAR